VDVVGYDVQWPAQFDAYADRVREALGPACLRIDHIGSTSVPGLAAKPVIDMQVSVADVAAPESYRPGLEGAGFLHRPHPEEPERREFFRPPGPRAVHVHVVEAGGPEERRQLLHRDYLRAHPEVAMEYGALKQRLARRFRDARQDYQEAKHPFLQSMGADAEAWAAATAWSPVTERGCQPPPG